MRYRGEPLCVHGCGIASMRLFSETTVALRLSIGDPSYGDLPTPAITMFNIASVGPFHHHSLVHYNPCRRDATMQREQRQAEDPRDMPAGRWRMTADLTIIEATRLRC